MGSILIGILQVLVVLFSQFEESYYLELTLLHSNNINFCFEETSDKTGGAARVLYYVKKYRKEAEEGNSPPVIYVNIGDNFSANRYNTGNQWKIIADYLNLLRPDAMCLGNHELNVGVENLTLFLQHLVVPVITANINFGHQHTLQTYITKKVITSN
ncbi:hypothetical protein QE152_g33128 [Popillia japonica]|uniref:5'-nucleotidase n=1 Tax=Popillia japonica TaxID=7064 RepID=A0AAW1IXE6_POPJA